MKALAVFALLAVLAVLAAVLRPAHHPRSIHAHRNRKGWDG